MGISTDVGERSPGALLIDVTKGIPVGSVGRKPGFQAVLSVVVVRILLVAAVFLRFGDKLTRERIGILF